MHKFIKYILKGYFSISVIVSVSFTLLFFFTSIPYVKERLKEEVSSRLSRSLDREVSIGEVSYGFPSTLLIDDLYVQGDFSDTLLKVSHFYFSLNLEGLLSQRLDVQSIYLQGVEVSVIDTSMQTTERPFSFLDDNYSSLLNEVEASYIVLEQVLFSYAGVDTLYLESNRISLENIQINQNSLSLQVSAFDCVSDGLTIFDSEGTIFLSDSLIRLEQLSLKTAHSEISLPYFQLNHYSNIDHLFVDATFNKSTIDLQEFSFLPLPIVRSRISLEGQIKGTAQHLSLTSLAISLGESHIVLSGEVKNAMIINDLHLNMCIEEAYVSRSEIQSDWALPMLEDSTLNDLSWLDIHGDLFFAKGAGEAILNIKTPLGDFSGNSQLSYRNDSMVFSSDIQAEEIVFKTQHTGQVNLIAYLESEIIYANDEISGYAELGFPVVAYQGKLYEDITVVLIGNTQRWSLDIVSADDDFPVALNTTYRQTEKRHLLNYRLTTNKISLVGLLPEKELEEATVTISLSGYIGYFDSNNYNANWNIDYATIEGLEKKFTLEKMNGKLAITPQHKKVSITSALFDLNLSGTFDWNTLPHSLSNIAQTHIPFLPQTVQEKPHNNLKLLATIHDPKKILDLVNLTAIQAEQPLNIGFTLDDTKEYAFVKIRTPNISVMETSYNDLSINLTSKGQLFSYDIEMGDTSAQYFSSTSFVNRGEAELSLIWQHENQQLFSGELNMNILLDSIQALGHTETASLWLFDTVWNSSFNFKSTIDEISISDFHLTSGESKLDMFLSASKEEADSITVNVENISLKRFLKYLETEGRYDGELNGKLSLAKSPGNFPEISTEISIKDFSIEEKPYGNFNVTLEQEEITKIAHFNTTIQNGDHLSLNGSGYYDRELGLLDISLAMDSLRVEGFKPFLTSSFNRMEGDVSGELQISGPLSHLQKEGLFEIDGLLGVGYLQTAYNFSDTLLMDDSVLHFNDISLIDSFLNVAKLNGKINYNQQEYEFSIYSDKVFVLNTDARDNPVYNGSVFVSGDYIFSLNNGRAYMEIGIETQKPSSITLDLIDRESAHDEFSFIQFLVRDSTILEKRNNKTESVEAVSSNVHLRLNESTELTVLMGELNTLKTVGNGDLIIRQDPGGAVSLYGTYELTQGVYNLVVHDLIQKNFQIVPGSQLSWEGDPKDATINLTAQYSIPKVSLQDILGQETARSKFETVECQIKLTGKLSAPIIDFKINLPFASDKDKAEVFANIPSESDMIQQFVYLLMFNSFLTPSYYQREQVSSTTAKQAVSATLSDFFSVFLSTLTKYAKISVKYQPSTEIEEQYVQVGVSTSLLNDRIVLSGNIGNRPNNINSTGVTQENSSNIIGDFAVDLKLNKTGSLNAKIYNKANTDLYSYYPYTGGIRLRHTSSFNKWKELIPSFLRKNDNNVAPQDTTDINQN